MRSCVALIVLCALSFEPALGADVPFPAAEPARAPIIYDPNGPYTNWAGAYLGVNGGYGFGSQWTIGLLGTSVFDTDGFLFGGAADPISAVMLGVEADVDWSGLSGSAANCAVNTSGAVAARQTKSSLLKAARAWAGYALDRTLIYMIGGAAIALGLAAGAGLEYAFAGNWSAKVEYLFIDLPANACSSVANCGTAAGSSVAFIESAVRGGFNYRLPW